FRRILTQFLAPGAIGEGWPRFILPGNNPNDIKLPGAYNAFALPAGQDITPPGQAVEIMKQLWKPCFLQPPPQDVNPKMLQVKSFFDANYTKYKSLSSNAPKVANSFEEMLRHIYGWVPFNEGFDAKANALADTAGYREAQRAYMELQYGADGKF